MDLMEATVHRVPRELRGWQDRKVSRESMEPQVTMEARDHRAHRVPQVPITMSRVRAETRVTQVPLVPPARLVSVVTWARPVIAPQSQMDEMVSLEKPGPLVTRDTRVPRDRKAPQEVRAKTPQTVQRVSRDMTARMVPAASVVPRVFQVNKVCCADTSEVHGCSVTVC